MDRSIVVLTIAEYVAGCDPLVVEMFALGTDYYMALIFIYDRTFLSNR